MQRNTIARVQVISEIGLIGALREFVREVALKEGFGPRDAEHLMLATEEGAVNVIEHALGNDANASYEMILEREPGRFILAFEDQGAQFLRGGTGDRQLAVTEVSGMAIASCFPPLPPYAAIKAALS